MRLQSVWNLSKLLSSWIHIIKRIEVVSPMVKPRIFIAEQNLFFSKLRNAVLIQFLNIVLLVQIVLAPIRCRYFTLLIIRSLIGQNNTNCAVFDTALSAFVTDLNRKKNPPVFNLQPTTYHQLSTDCLPFIFMNILTFMIAELIQLIQKLLL